MIKTRGVWRWRQEIDLWKVDDANPGSPLVVMGYGYGSGPTSWPIRSGDVYGRKDSSEIVEAVLANIRRSRAPTWNETWLNS
jgi:hypothetical protein